MAHILIIEDNPDIVGLVKKLFTTEGHIVTSASDGEMGIVAVKRDRPDLVILDLNLPKKDGREVCQELKADRTTRHIPIVMLTAAYTDAEDARRGLSLGADEYVIKPFMHTPFMACVIRLLPKAPV